MTETKIVWPNLLRPGGDLNALFAQENEKSFEVWQCKEMANNFQLDVNIALQTSCLVSAQAIRWSATNQLYWKDRRKIYPEKAELFQIEFCEDELGENIEHILTVHKDEIWQSFWLRSYLKCTHQNIDHNHLISLDGQQMWNYLVKEKFKSEAPDNVYIFYTLEKSPR